MYPLGDDTMSMDFSAGFSRLQQYLQGVTLLLIAIFALGMIGATLLAALGVIPWLDAPLSFGDYSLPDGGMYVQIAITAFALALAFYLPANRRILALERSHRTFNMRMEDVARAYRIAHQADREGVFTLSSEFDSVRDRINHLRKHPDLAGLEPDVLEVAAQMSHEARDLAEVYSEEKVTRARTFLEQRQKEIEDYQERIAIARYSVEQLRRWTQDVKAEEKVVEQQLQRLEADLREVLPALGYKLEEGERNVVSLPKKSLE